MSHRTLVIETSIARVRSSATAALTIVLLGCRAAGVHDPILHANQIIGGQSDFGLITDLVLLHGHQIAVLDVGEYCVKTISLENGRVLTSVGTKGRGPKQLLSPVALGAFEDGDSLSVTDAATLRVQIIRAVPKLETADELSAYQIAFSHSWRGDTLIASGFWYPQPIKKFVREGLSLKEVGGIGKPVASNVNMLAAQQLNRNVSVRGPGVIAAAYLYYARVDFWRDNGTYVKTYSRNSHLSPSATVIKGHFRTSDDTKWAYVDLAASPQGVFALYSGRSREDDRHTAALSTQVELISWQGHLIKRWRLDTPVLAIAYDAETGFLYGARVLPFPALLRFRVDLNGYDEP